jgi:hypothetical protein
LGTVSRLCPCVQVAVATLARLLSHRSPFPSLSPPTVGIVAVHVDAVLETPYYTIQLPDGRTKQTNWDNLMPEAEYRKRTAICGGISYEQERSSPRDGGRSRASSRGQSSGRSARRGGRSRSASSRRDDDGTAQASRGSAPRAASRAAATTTADLPGLGAP